MKTNKRNLKITKKQKENAKKVLLQVAVNYTYARTRKLIDDKTSGFMFIVANTIEEWEKINKEIKNEK